MSITKIARAVSTGLVFALALASEPVASVSAQQGLLTPNDLVSAPWPEPDHRITYGTDPLQFGYLRLPGGEGPHPVVVFIHGGCYLSMFDIQHAGQAEQALADEGYAVWSIEYRR